MKRYLMGYIADNVWQVVRLDAKDFLEAFRKALAYCRTHLIDPRRIAILQEEEVYDER